MNCPECQEPFDGRDCEVCRREQALYSAYAASIAVPDLWPAIEARIAARWRPSHSWRLPLAAAATIALLIAGGIAIRKQAPPTPATLDPVSTAAAHYEVAIARLEPAVRSRASSAEVAGTLALLPQLSDAIRIARQQASRAPDDPAVATTLIAAYDAKLQLLRSITYEQ
jgi:outer membrane murein-binding lipoprotein Lpp